MLPDSKKNWSAEDSAETYRLDDWNAGHFSIKDTGDLAIECQVNGSDVSIPIMDIIEGMQDRDLYMPALIRVENILNHSLKTLNEAFKNAINNCGYQNVYRGVFPIKVNQQAQIVEEIVRFGQPYCHGLEAGSKPELIIALAMLENEE
ncbi:MAG: arginine decarboxylase, partial [Pseudomonadales bacterium]